MPRSRKFCQRRSKFDNALFLFFIVAVLFLFFFFVFFVFVFVFDEGIEDPNTIGGLMIAQHCLVAL